MLTISGHGGTGGAIKRSPDDFVVKEITSKGHVLEPGKVYDARSLDEEEVPAGKQITFVLEKRDWNTSNAVLAIAKRMGRGRKSMGYAGTKDKFALSVQLASVFHPEPFDMSSIRMKDISINGSWRSDGVRLGTNLGNAFDVVIRSATSPNAADAIAEELGGTMPNYFGSQRFGERQNNAKIGTMIMRNELEEAALEFLTGTTNERNEDIVAARRRLRDEGDYKEALSYFPKFLKGERSVIAYLAENKGRYANAFRMLPRGLLLMLIHAVQDQVFNDELDQRIRERNFKSPAYAQRDFYGFPDVDHPGKSGDFPLSCMVGYETKEEDISDYTRDLMERAGIRKEDFKLKSIPELSTRGSYRALLAPVKNLSHSVEENGTDVRLRFELPGGSYATVLLNEFVKS
ncbi:putative tRNA pseudouridine synthase D [uncultured archaeon]|nr:putative tRNA pseudouridine synthase D [uncultured archaeon]